MKVNKTRYRKFTDKKILKNKLVLALYSIMFSKTPAMCREGFCYGMYGSVRYDDKNAERLAKFRVTR